MIRICRHHKHWWASVDIDNQYGLTHLACYLIEYIVEPFFFYVSDIYQDMIVESVIYRHDQEWSAFAGIINIDGPR